MGKVVTFGEIMLRLAPKGYLRFSQADEFDAVYGGGEANVSVSLANYGIDVSFITRLPENPIGYAAERKLKSYGVGTNHVAWGGDRLGIYFLEKGASQRPSKVVYDRKNSAISTALKNDFDWDEIFKGAEWFHFTGISPALGEGIAKICEEACKVAKKNGVKISCDLNYRKNLWTPEEANRIMITLMEYVDVCIGNEEDAQKIFGIKSKGTDVTGGKLNDDGYRDVAEELIKRFNFSTVAITLRESISASVNNWGAMIYDGNNIFFSPKYNIQIIDRVGGGDSFAGGLIYGLLKIHDLAEALNFAVAASCLKHTIEGDFNDVSIAEIMNLVKGNQSGRVER